MTMATCTIETTQFTKNGSTNFNCAVEENDNVGIEVIVSGSGEIELYVRYQKPDGTTHRLLGDSKLVTNYEIWSLSVPDIVPGTYKILETQVFDSNTGQDLCRRVY